MRAYFRIGFPQYGKNSVFKDKVEIVIDKNGRVLGATNKEKLTELALPYSAEELALTEVAGDAFRDSRNLESLVIENGIEEIGESAFKGCSKLSCVKLSESVYRIGGSAFENALSLSAVELSEGLEEIGSKAFYNTIKLRSIKIPKSVKRIGAMAFALTHSLEYIVIPEGIEELSEGILMDSGIRKIELPSTLKRISSAAFSRAAKLSAIYYNGSLEDFRKIAFGLHWNYGLKEDIDLYLRDSDGSYYNAFKKSEEKSSKDNNNIDRALKILGLDKKATKKDIEKAFREKAKKFHPDMISAMNLDPEFIEFAAAKFRELQDAEELLLKEMGG